VNSQCVPTTYSLNNESKLSDEPCIKFQLKIVSRHLQLFVFDTKSSISILSKTDFALKYVFFVYFFSFFDTLEIYWDSTSQKYQLDSFPTRKDT